MKRKIALGDLARNPGPTRAGSPHFANAREERALAFMRATRATYLRYLSPLTPVAFGISGLIS